MHGTLILSQAHPCTLPFSLSHTHKHTFSDATALPPKLEELLPRTLDFCPLSKCQGLFLITTLNSQALSPDKACVLSGNTSPPGSWAEWDGRAAHGPAALCSHSVGEAPPALPRGCSEAPRLCLHSQS